MDINTALNISNLVLDKGIATVMATIIGSIIGAIISIYLARKNFDKQRQLLQEPSRKTPIFSYWDIRL